MLHYLLQFLKHSPMHSFMVDPPPPPQKSLRCAPLQAPNSACRPIPLFDLHFGTGPLSPDAPWP